MKIGASNYYLSEAFGEKKAIEMMAKAGFNSIDFNLRLTDKLTGNKLFTVYSDEEFIAHFQNVKKILDENHISVLQTHSHTGHFNFTNTEEYFNITVKDIKASAILGSPYIVIHPLILPSYIYDQNKEECKKYNMEFYARLIPYLEKYNVKNGVEPMWQYDDENGNICPTVCSRPEEIIDYIETLNSDRFVACLDLGHINLTCKYTGDTVDGAIYKLGKYLKVLHVHDTDGIDDLHVPPFFMGNIDWLKVTKALKDVGYKGVFNFEVGPKYFSNFSDEKIQSAVDYLYQTGKFLTALIEE